MRKLLSIFSLALLFCTIAFGQAAVDIPITVSDNNGSTSDIYFGLDLAATDGIDPALGELVLPGFPPSGYAAAWLYPDFATMSYWDYRAPGSPPAFPYTGSVNWTIRLQNDVVNNPMTVSWNLPPEIAATSTITAGTQTIPFEGTGEIVFDYNPSPVPGQTLTFVFITVDFENIGPVVPIPIFDLDPLSLDFGTIVVGTPSLPQVVTVTNTGDANLEIDNITSSDVQYEFTPNAGYPIVIAPLGTQDFDVVFTPNDGGPQPATIDFFHNAAGSPGTLDVTGIGESPLPSFRVEPTALDFENTNLNTPKTLFVTVYNDGTVDPLVISSAFIAEPEFVVDLASATILAGQSQVFNVTFTPLLEQNYTGTLEFVHNAVGSPDEVPLEGVGYVAPEVFGLVFENIDTTVYENDSYSSYMDLLDLNGPVNALQFTLATNMETGDNIILTYQSIVKNSGAISGPDWILETNVVRGTINANGASEDLIHVLLYNISQSAALTGSYDKLFKVNYKVAKLPPPPIVEQHSTFKILNAEASTSEGFPVDIVPSTDILTVNVQAAGSGYGDVNGDGCVDILDLMLVVDHILERELLTGDAFTRADIAPWYDGDDLPTPDMVVNVQDLSLIQNIILTGYYPNGQPVSACGYLAKLEGAADATVTIYINSEGISTFVDAEIGIRGAQIEFSSVSNNPENMIINTPLGQGYYLRVNELLRTLMYDRTGQKSIDAGVNNFMADMPFALNNPNDVLVAKIVLVDINTEKMSNILVQVIYGTPNLPLDYILFQNYPNPFNPTTDIRFQIPETGDVTLKIYDMLGQEIRTLFTGVTERGTYTVQWDGLNNTGSKMSSGTYIYRMTTGDFVQSKKMMLLK